MASAVEPDREGHDRDGASDGSGGTDGADGSTDGTGKTDGDDDAHDGRQSAGVADDELYTRKRTVLITGCGSAIGRATAEAFLREDWFVVATARDPDDLATLGEAGCETATLDVTDPEAVLDVVETTLDRTGAIDCLVNGEGYARLGPLEDVTMADLHAQFDVNVYGPHRLVRAVLPHMRSRGEGRIVNVSSVFGRLSAAGAGPYAGSKHALEAMSDALRAEVDEFGIDVVLVQPGPVRSRLASRAVDEPPTSRRTPAYGDLYDLVADLRLLGDDGPVTVEPREVAGAVLHAATCPDPPARYPVGPVSNVGQYARFLPDDVRDSLYDLLRRLV